MRSITLLSAFFFLFFSQLVSAQGEAIFNERCKQCHALPQNIGERSPQQLAQIVDIMQGIMQARGTTPLTATEKSKLLIFLESKAKAAGAERASLAEDAFMVRCGLCHQTPEPGMLKINQWKIVLRTMDQRMTQANVPLMDEEERTLVLEYLNQHSRK